MRPVILFLSHKAYRCGIGQFGRDLFSALEKSEKYQFNYAEVESEREARIALASCKFNGGHPDVSIWNYFGQTMPWIDVPKRSFEEPRICIPHHDMTQEAVDACQQGGFFTHWVFPNPGVETGPLKSPGPRPFVFKTHRLVAEFKAPSRPVPAKPKKAIGTFGFGTSVKRLDLWVREVRENFRPEEVDIRLHMAGNDVIDKDGMMGRGRMSFMVSALPGYSFEMSSDYKTQNELVEWLAENDLNVFLYDGFQKGISSAIDQALAAGKPIAVNKVPAFGHLAGRPRSPYVEDYPRGTGLKMIMNNADDFADLQKEGAPGNILHQWEQILDAVLGEPL